MKNCLICGKQLVGPNWQLKNKKYCSRNCLGKANSQKLFGNKHAKGHAPNKTSWKKGETRGSKNVNWNGGKYVDGRGYVFIKRYEHPRAVRGYVAEHVIIAEKKIGRLLLNNEHVHHINGIKGDNRPENLAVLTRIEHLKKHLLPRGSTGQFLKISMLSKKCGGKKK